MGRLVWIGLVGLGLLVTLILWRTERGRPASPRDEPENVVRAEPGTAELVPANAASVTNVERSRGRPEESLITDEDGRAEYLVRAEEEYDLIVDGSPRFDAEGRSLPGTEVRAVQSKDLKVPALAASSVISSYSSSPPSISSGAVA